MRQGIQACAIAAQWKKQAGNKRKIGDVKKVFEQ